MGQTRQRDGTCGPCPVSGVLAPARAGWHYEPIPGDTCGNVQLVADSTKTITTTGDTPPAPTVECGRWVPMGSAGTWTCDPNYWHPIQPGPNWGRITAAGITSLGVLSLGRAALKPQNRTAYAIVGSLAVIVGVFGWIKAV